MGLYNVTREFNCAVTELVVPLSQNTLVLSGIGVYSHLKDVQPHLLLLLDIERTINVGIDPKPVDW
jgi:hypothetical protein